MNEFWALTLALLSVATGVVLGILLVHAIWRYWPVSKLWTRTILHHQYTTLWNKKRIQRPEWKPKLDNLIIDDSDLSGINLRGALLIGTKIENTNLKYADLSNCRIIDSELTNVNISNALMNGIRFQNTIIASLNGLKEAHIDKETLEEIQAIITENDNTETLEENYFPIHNLPSDVFDLESIVMKLKSKTISSENISFYDFDKIIENLDERKENFDYRKFPLANDIPFATSLAWKSLESTKKPIQAIGYYLNTHPDEKLTEARVSCTRFWKPSKSKPIVIFTNSIADSKIRKSAYSIGIAIIDLSDLRNIATGKKTDLLIERVSKLSPRRKRFFGLIHVW